MLSEENRSKLSPDEIAAAHRDAMVAARQLGTVLVQGERNPDYRERELENPAHGVHIRITRPMPPSQQFGYDVAEAKLHNEFVSSLGVSGRRFEP